MIGLMLWIASGTSMLHMGIQDGDIIKATCPPCEVRDVIAFEYNNERYVKQLMHYGYDGCMYVKGRNGSWWDGEPRRKVVSLDSRTWGCLPADEYKILGCVELNKQSKK